MKNRSFLIVSLVALLFWSFMRDSSPEAENNLLTRISNDQNLNLMPYMMDYHEISEDGDIDTLVLFLTVDPNPDSTSAEMLLWNLRCTRSSNTSEYVEYEYDGGCKEQGVVVPSEIKLGKYDSQTGNVEVLCGETHYMTIDCNGL